MTSFTEEVVSKCVLEKTFICKVCNNDFKQNVVRDTKLKYISSDFDLHANYEPIEPLLYDVYVCPHCGYSATSMFFNKIPNVHIPKILQHITPRYTPRKFNKVLSYNDGIDRHKMALLTSMVRGAKPSELGYVCVKIAWLYRIVGNEEQYIAFANKAITELEKAYSEEYFPICEMKEATFEYLVASFMYAVGRYDDGYQWLGRVILSRNVNDRLKNKAFDLKELFQEKINTKSQNLR